MAQLTIRQVDDELVRALKIRAAKAGRSAEAEARKILADALQVERARHSLREHLLAIPDVGDDAEFDRVDQPMGEPDC